MEPVTEKLIVNVLEDVEKDALSKSVYDKIVELTAKTPGLPDVRKWLASHGFTKESIHATEKNWKQADKGDMTLMCKSIESAFRKRLVDEVAEQFAVDVRSDKEIQSSMKEYYEFNETWLKEATGEVSKERMKYYADCVKSHVEKFNKILNEKIGKHFVFYSKQLQDLLTVTCVRVLIMDQFLYVEIMKQYPVFWYEYYADDIWNMIHFVTSSIKFEIMYVWNEKPQSLPKT
jgi:hypothetical protein